MCTQTHAWGWRPPDCPHPVSLRSGTPTGPSRLSGGTTWPVLAGRLRGLSTHRVQGELTVLSSGLPFLQSASSVTGAATLSRALCLDVTPSSCATPTPSASKSLLWVYLHPHHPPSRTSRGNVLRLLGSRESLGTPVTVTCLTHLCHFRSLSVLDAGAPTLFVSFPQSPSLGDIGDTQDFSYLILGVPHILRRGGVTQTIEVLPVASA